MALPERGNQTRPQHPGRGPAMAAGAHGRWYDSVHSHDDTTGGGRGWRQEVGHWQQTVLGERHWAAWLSSACLVLARLGLAAEPVCSYRGALCARTRFPRRPGSRRRPWRPPRACGCSCAAARARTYASRPAHLKTSAPPSRVSGTATGTRPALRAVGKVLWRDSIPAMSTRV